MFGVGERSKILYQQEWQGNLSEYVTQVAWSSNGLLAASSAAGEVVLWQNDSLINLLPADLASIDCLAFSNDGKFLAAGGQDGKVRVWSILDYPLSQGGLGEIYALDNAPSWIDKLAWSPSGNQLAFSLGRYVQIWDADTQTVVTTLPFSNSSVLDLAWQPNGENIAIAVMVELKFGLLKIGMMTPISSIYPQLVLLLLGLPIVNILLLVIWTIPLLFSNMVAISLGSCRVFLGRFLI